MGEKLDTKNKTKETLILSGDAAKDFKAFLSSKEKPFDFGLQLIDRYTRNRTLYDFLQKHREGKFTHKVLVENIKIISRKWLTK